MIKFKAKQTNSIVISTQPEVQQQTYCHQTQGVYGVDCGICGVRGYCNADLFLRRGDICPQFAYDDGRAKDPDDF